MPEIVGRYFTVAGRQAYCEICGSGPPVLLIHTAGRDSRQWHGVIESLADRFLLIAPDLPGHGKSWPMSGNACLQDAREIAKWLSACMEAIGHRQFAVVGCSLGGNLSLLMSALNKGVTAVAGFQAADYTPTFTCSALDLMTHPQINLMHASMDFSMSLVGRDSSAIGREFSEWGVLSLSPLAQQGDLRAYSRCDIRGLMAEVTCPVMIVRGTDDWLVSQEMVDATCERLINAQAVEKVSLPGLGHFPHVERPERVAELLGGFLSRYIQVE